VNFLIEREKRINMYTFLRVSLSFILFFSITSTSIYGNEEKMPFQIESGTIIYEITGGAELTPETNLTIKGRAKLRFKDWGKVKIEEESGILLTTGAIKHQEKVKKFVKETEDNIIIVDYSNEQLIERKRAASKNPKDDIKNLAYKGKSTIADIECDLWEGMGIRKCMFKGIILLLESHVYTAHYSKKAITVLLDINHTKEEFTLPDYPIHKIGFFKDNKKTKNTTKTGSFRKLIKNKVAISGDKVSFTQERENRKKQKFLNNLGKDIFIQQKKLLPDLLLSMQKTRACLQTVENPFEANECIEEFSHMKEKLGSQEDDYIILWDQNRKEILLDKIEDELTGLQAKNPCIKRAKNITDLSACLKNE